MNLNWILLTLSFAFTSIRSCNRWVTMSRSPLDAAMWSADWFILTIRKYAAQWLSLQRVSVLTSFLLSISALASIRRKAVPLWPCLTAPRKGVYSWSSFCKKASLDKHNNALSQKIVNTVYILYCKRDPNWRLVWWANRRFHFAHCAQQDIKASNPPVNTIYPLKRYRPRWINVRDFSNWCRPFARWAANKSLQGHGLQHVGVV